MTIFCDSFSTKMLANCTEHNHRSMERTFQQHTAVPVPSLEEIMRSAALRLVTCCLVILSTSFAVAQTQATETLGIVTANQVSNGLGFNLDPGQDWQWAAAAAAGATHARMDCLWSSVEQQTAPPLNKPAAVQYIQDPACVKGFASALKYGIHPTVVAAFGPPHHQILTVTIPKGAPIGATSVDLTFVSGVGGDTLANIAYPYSYIQGSAALTANTYGKLSANGSYQGTFITGITRTDGNHATITLASALILPLPANDTEYKINEVLYPSAATESPTDPSVIEYDNYVMFLAKDMASRGITGDIEIWNEPPWRADPWDDRGDLYDAALWPGPVAGGPAKQITANFGFIADLQTRTFPAGITATWNGTSGNGTSSVLAPGMFNSTGEYFSEPSTGVTKESFHPYGITPEQGNWETSCLQAAASATSYPGNNPYFCSLSGEKAGNALDAVFLDMKAKLTDPTYGVGHSVTETGTVGADPGHRVAQARWEVRQFLAYEGDGITPIEFYKLYDSTTLTDPNFSFIEEIGNSGFYNANPNFTSLSGLMGDIDPISNPPVAPYPASTLPSVANYSGTYPLTSVHMVGARTGASTNSDIFAVWQRSYPPCDATNNCGTAQSFLIQPAPTPAPVTINIPAGMSVTEVVNLTTRAAVNYTRSGQQITFAVADDAIEVLVDPSSEHLSQSPALPTVTTLSSTAASHSYAGQVVLTAKLAPYTTAGHSSNGESITFYNGSTPIGTGTLSSGVATLNITSLPTGSNTLVAQYPGDKQLLSSAGSSIFTTTQATANLSFTSIPAQTYGTASVVVSAQSNAPGAITYVVVSGPARVGSSTSTNATITLSAAGTVVLKAIQAASANYAAATTQVSFVINPKIPNLVFSAIGNTVYGVRPFPIAAYSASAGSITYSVVSGPATVSGNTVTLTGAGTVILQASQVAAGNYAATTAQVTLVVTGANTGSATLVFAPVANTIYGTAAFAVSATSVSTGTVSYSVLSGPATITGNMVIVTGTGTVVLKASQAATSKYSATSAQTSFTVSAATPNLVFSAIGDKAYGIPAFAVMATSASPGPITYTVLSGPATIVGNLVTLTGIGPVVVRASQAASSNYLAASAQTGISVISGPPALALRSVGDKIYGAAPFDLIATSTSPGPITYSVVSGSARILGNHVTITGLGPVVVSATQAATANYGAATTSTSFNINAGTLTLVPIENQALARGKTVVHPISASTGAITCSVVHGPAVITGSVITFTGTGTVVIRATQIADANYPTMTAQQSFDITP